MSKDALTKMRQFTKGPRDLPKVDGLAVYVVLGPRQDGEGADVLGAFTDSDKADALVDYFSDQGNEHWTPGVYSEQIELNVDYLNVLRFLTFNAG